MFYIVLDYIHAIFHYMILSYMLSSHIMSPSGSLRAPERTGGALGHCRGRVSSAPSPAGERRAATPAIRSGRSPRGGEHIFRNSSKPKICYVTPPPRPSPGGSALRPFPRLPTERQPWQVLIEGNHLSNTLVERRFSSKVANTLANYGDP